MPPVSSLNLQEVFLVTTVFFAKDNRLSEQQRQTLRRRKLGFQLVRKKEKHQEKPKGYGHPFCIFVDLLLASTISTWLLNEGKEKFVLSAYQRFILAGDNNRN